MVKTKTKTPKHNQLSRRENRTAFWFMLPAYVGLIVLTYVPLLVVFGLSFFKWKGISSPEWGGLFNYIRLFTKDPYFKDSLRVTVIFTLLSVFGSMIYSLVVAMLLNRKIPARGFFRAVFYLPYVLPAAAVYIGWSWLYETNFGLFNYILKNIFGIQNVMFLADKNAVLPSLALIAVWLSGNLIVIFLAGLQDVPRVYHEAAEIDGANGWQRFWNITVPCMSPIIFYNLLMSMITNLQVVTPALSLTSGGPGNETTFITYLMYRYAFKNNQIGYACAISFILFILIAILTGCVFASSGGWVFYEGGDD